jgi:hypothetical protein
VPVYAFINLMQNARIQYQFDPCVRDDHRRAFNIEDIPISNPKIKLAVGVVGAGQRRSRYLG